MSTDLDDLESFDQIERNDSENDSEEININSHDNDGVFRWLEKLEEKLEIKQCTEGGAKGAEILILDKDIDFETSPIIDSIAMDDRTEKQDTVLQSETGIQSEPIMQSDNVSDTVPSVEESLPVLWTKTSFPALAPALAPALLAAEQEPFLKPLEKPFLKPLERSLPVPLGESFRKPLERLSPGPFNCASEDEIVIDYSLPDIINLNNYGVGQAHENEEEIDGEDTEEDTEKEEDEQNKTLDELPDSTDEFGFDQIYNEGEQTIFFIKEEHKSKTLDKIDKIEKDRLNSNYDSDSERLHKMIFEDKNRVEVLVSGSGTPIGTPVKEREKEREKGEIDFNKIFSAIKMEGGMEMEMKRGVGMEMGVEVEEVGMMPVSVGEWDLENRQVMKNITVQNIIDEDEILLQSQLQAQLVLVVRETQDRLVEENIILEERGTQNRITEEMYRIEEKFTTNIENKCSIDEKYSVELDLQSLSADTVSGHSVNGWTRFTTEEGWPYYYHAGGYCTMLV